MKNPDDPRSTTLPQVQNRSAPSVLPDRAAIERAIAALHSIPNPSADRAEALAVEQQGQHAVHNAVRLIETEDGWLCRFRTELWASTGLHATAPERPPYKLTWGVSEVAARFQRRHLSPSAVAIDGEGAPADHLRQLIAQAVKPAARPHEAFANTAAAFACWLHYGRSWMDADDQRAAAEHHLSVTARAVAELVRYRDQFEEGQRQALTNVERFLGALQHKRDGERWESARVRLLAEDDDSLGVW